MRPYILTVNKDPRLSGVVSLFIHDDPTETAKERRLRYQKRASKRYSTLSREQRETDGGFNAKKKPVSKFYMIKKKPVLKLYRIDKSVESSPQVETSSPAPASTVSTEQELEDRLKQEPENHIKQAPEDHFKHEPEVHHKLEDHVQQEPKDHVKEKLEDRLKQAPEDHFQQEFEHYVKHKLEDCLKRPPEDHLEQKPKDHLEQKPKDHLEQKPKDHLELKPKDHLELKPKDHLELKPKDHLEQKPKDHLKQEPEDHLEQKPEDHLKQELEDHLTQEPENHLQQAPKDHLYAMCARASIPEGTVYQPVTIVTPQGQPVTRAISPGTKRAQNNQPQSHLHQDPNLVGDEDDDGSSKNKRTVLSKKAINVLHSWLLQHNTYPYPTEDDKKQIATQTNLTLVQINNWFINARRRILQRILQPSMLDDASPSETPKFKKTTAQNNRTFHHFCRDPVAARVLAAQQRVTLPDSALQRVLARQGLKSNRSAGSGLQVKISSPAPASTVSIKQEPEEDRLIQGPQDHLYTTRTGPGRGKRQRRLPQHLQDFNSVSRGSKGDVPLAPEHPGSSTNRKDFLQYSFPLSLDPNTTGRFLQLLEENRKVLSTLQNQSYPDHPERFSRHEQVLSRESLPGPRCYFEVDWVGYLFGVAVSYGDIDRKGEDLSVFGYNDKSWRLDCEGGASGFTFTHNGVVTYGSLRCASRVGVYVDRRAGILSFYSVSVSDDTMTLLHSVRANFTKPLYAGIWLFGIAEFCNTRLKP